MAKIYEGSTTNTGKIRVARNVGSVVIVSNTLHNFANITLSATIERSGSNEEICTDVPLIDFLLLNKIGESQVRIVQGTHGASGGLTHCSIELDFGSGAGLIIGSNDTLVFELKGLGAIPTRIYSLDDLDYGNIYRKHEYKNMLSDEKQRTFQTNGAEFCLISSNVDKIRSVVMRTADGKRLEYEVEELRHLHAQISPMIGLKPVTSTTIAGFHPLLPEYSEALIIPVFDIQEIEINRATNGLIPVHFQYDMSYAPVVPKRMAPGTQVATFTGTSRLSR